MGIDRYIEFYILPLFDSEGETCNYFITTLDITDDRNRDRDRHQHNKKVHDIKTDIERKKQTLAFFLKYSDRHLEQDDDGRMRIVVNNARLEEARLQLQAVTAQVDESVRLKSGFMVSMTNEMRTPLNAIVRFSGLLETQGDNPERGEYVHMIRNYSDMLQRLVNDISIPKDTP
jgi:signal transduction histidine kinase